MQLSFITNTHTHSTLSYRTNTDMIRQRKQIMKILEVREFNLFVAKFLMLR